MVKSFGVVGVWSVVARVIIAQVPIVTRDGSLELQFLIWGVLPKVTFLECQE